MANHSREFGFVLISRIVVLNVFFTADVPACSPDSCLHRYFESKLKKFL